MLGNPSRPRQVLFHIFLIFLLVNPFGLVLTLNMASAFYRRVGENMSPSNTNQISSGAGSSVADCAVRCLQDACNAFTWEPSSKQCATYPSIGTVITMDGMDIYQVSGQFSSVNFGLFKNLWSRGLISFLVHLQGLV